MILLKTQNIQLRAPTYLKNDQDKKVITSIQSVWVTRPTRKHSGAISACLGPISSVWHKFWGFEATLRQFENELLGFRTAFCFVNISVP